jgi:hypothetical protein
LRLVTARPTTEERACVKVLSCKGIGGFEGAKDALTLSLIATDLDTETKRVSAVIL